MKQKFLSVILFDKFSKVGYKRTIRDINFLIKSLKKKDKLLVIDLRKYYLGKKIVKNFSYKNSKIQYFKPKNIFDLIKFTKNKIIFSYGPINPEIKTFLIFLIIRITGIRLFFFNSYGYYLNENTLDEPNIRFKIFYFIKWKFSYYFYRILSLIKIFPSILCYFETSDERIQKINNTKFKKIHQFFNLVDFNYFKKIRRINSIYHDELFYKKYNNVKKNIVLIDSGLGHPDSLDKDSNYNKMNDKEIILFYKKILNKLENFSKKKKLKIYFCKHPKSYYPKNCFKNFKNINFNFNADKHIFTAKYVFFTGGTSMINKAILLRKNFFILISKQTQKFSLRLLESINLIFKLNYIDIDDKVDLLKNLTTSKLFNSKKYDKFINKHLIFKRDVHSSNIIKDTLFEDNGKKEK